MSEDSHIKRKDLWDSLGNLKKKDWLKAAEKLGLLVTTPNSGTSHYAIRKPSIPIEDIGGLITTVYDGMSKQVNGKVFKTFLKHGIKEDDLWKALRKL